MLKEFKDFILRGNVIQLAIAFVIGAAFTVVVKGFVTDLVTPLISIPGTASFENLQVVVHHSVFRYGDFLNDLVAFLLVAAVLFFLVVRPLDALDKRRKSRQGDTEPETKDCPECTTTIPYAARRCPACTSQLEASA